MMTPAGFELTEPQKTDFPEIIAILPLKNTVVFPNSVLPLAVGRESSVKLVEDALSGTKIIGVLTQRDPNIEHPTPRDVYQVGTICRIARVTKTPNNALLLWVQGLQRFAVETFTHETPYLIAKIRLLESIVEKDIETEALSKQVMALFHKMLSLLPNPQPEIHTMAASLTDPGQLADFITANLDIETEAKQQVLETLNVKERLTLVLRLLEEENEILEVGSRIHTRVQEEIGRSTRERILREQLEAIKKELGEEEGPEIEELRRKIKQAKMPKDVEKEAMRELERLAQMHPSSAEYTVSRTYLDWLIALPWSKTTKDTLDIARARQILDEDHYDLEKVKERVLEYLAVLKLKKDMKGPILCLVGPPGVGKTSLGRSIARALGRKFVRISLGGVRDEAEIRGHRRTYVGALPGRIIQGLRRAGSKNPVFMLDEVDKMSSDFRGDPASALLEVLDPEQNSNFTDHYLDVPFDLSKVLFITTANVLYTIPAPLLDRMEVLELPGYSEDEKVQIARRYLIPKQIKAHGLRANQVEFSESALRQIIRDYTHEAGVRNLEREIGAVCRKIAVQVAEKRDRSRRFIQPEDLPKLLGPPRYFSEVAERLTKSGVAIGLVVTQVGGDIVFIEATKMKGKGELKLTGQLGEVMRESAQAALSYIRANAEQFGIDPDFFATHDIHIHVPEGAIPKDGPSAGVTIVTALASLLTDTPVQPDLAMTGEITLRGKVLPVGGIREKVLAAHRAGIKTVILPKRNEKDLEELPQNVKEALRFEFVEEISQVLEIAVPRHVAVA
ncbi:MAG: endopeptidase La [Candidatus Bipolaricaulota bacterium]|nr:endopeptidase La [Candidatus Bipolaricaulota bacterium]MDW8030790.1 endopeptidase La [Candidatus Bipolaricaulota bacterium]